MLVIGHRGAAGDAPENTIEAMRLGHKGGADMLEFDIQLTRDGVPVIIHDMTLRRTHKKYSVVRLSSLAQIDRAAAEGHKIALLEEVLDEFFGHILLNLELKSIGCTPVVMRLLKKHYIREPSDWDYLLISSFRLTELRIARRMSKDAHLGLLHHRNPFKFLLVHSALDLTAVGFSDEYVTPEIIDLAKKTKLLTYVYTVNTPDTAKTLEQTGVDGIVTDHPKDLSRHLSS